MIYSIFNMYFYNRFLTAKKAQRAQLIYFQIELPQIRRFFNRKGCKAGAEGAERLAGRQTLDKIENLERLVMVQSRCKGCRNFYRKERKERRNILILPILHFQIIDSFPSANQLIRQSANHFPAKGTEASYHVARMARPFAFSAKGFAQKHT